MFIWTNANKKPEKLDENLLNSKQRLKIINN